MELSDRINAIKKLYDFLTSKNGQEWKTEQAYRAGHQNNWFTVSNVLLAFENIESQMLQESSLNEFIVKYNFKIPESPKQIGVLMAGNIPLVGFYDALCVFLSGHTLLAKLSSQDEVLMKAILIKLIEIEPKAAPFIQFADKLNTIDALIATGSDNTAMHFEQYFKHVPRIIRKNRSSVAILNGNETKNDFENLGNDIFDFYGLGCRNVSKFYIPKNFAPDLFYQSIEAQAEVMSHHKYKNNYDYNRSVNLVNGTQHFDNGFLMLVPSANLVSPISVIFTEEYENEQDLKAKIEANEGKIQCIVSQNAWWPNSYNFGDSQKPGLNDFADGVDVLQFLIDLK